MRTAVSGPSLTSYQPAAFAAPLFRGQAIPNKLNQEGRYFRLIEENNLSKTALLNLQSHQLPELIGTDTRPR